MTIMRLTLAKRVRFVSALRFRSFALLWSGQAISTFGDAVFTMAMIWVVLILTGSATAMGLIVFAQWIPKIVFLLLGGVTADRVSRRALMICSDTGRGCIVLLVAYLSWAHLLQLWHLFLLNILFGIIDSFFVPAYQALEPQLVAAEDLTSVNSLDMLVRQLSSLIGPIAGAGLIATFGVGSAFAFDGFTFFASVLCVLVLRLPRIPLTQVPQQAALSTETGGTVLGKGPSSILRDAYEGLRYVRGSVWLLASILLASLANVGLMGSMWVALPKLVQNVYGLGIWLIGFISASAAIGSIVAALILGNIPRLRGRGILSYVAIAVSGLALIAFAFPRSLEPGAAIIASFFVGCGIAIFNIIWGTIQQEKVPNDKLGRVSSIAMLGSVSILPVGVLVAGVLADQVGPSQVFIICGSLIVVPALISLCFRNVRQIE
ncbi:MAG TPA: MFS transporter [Ktedonobacteraceae bacterium]|nr:MFS transporter [Ktedonobacteraceae bacterium]